MKVHHLYKITAPDGRAYIGVSVDTPKRFTSHSNAKSPIGEAIREHGRANMRFEVIDSGEREHIYRREVETIAALNTRSPNGFNISEGGWGSRDIHESTSAKMSASRTGKKFSDDHCANISAAIKGRKLSDEHCAKMSAAQTGRKRSAETRAKIAAAKTGIKLSDEHCEKLSAARTGSKRSAETKAKLSECQRGKKLRAESIEKRTATRARKRAEREAAKQLEAAE